MPIAREVFDAHMTGDNQLDRSRDDVHVRRRRSCCRRRAARVTEEGLRLNIRVGMQYIEAWLRGQRCGAALQPDGGRGDGGDLTRAGVAVDPSSA